MQHQNMEMEKKVLKQITARFCLFLWGSVHRICKLVLICACIARTHIRMQVNCSLKWHSIKQSISLTLSLRLGSLAFFFLLLIGKIIITKISIEQIESTLKCWIHIMLRVYTGLHSGLHNTSSGGVQSKISKFLIFFIFCSAKNGSTGSAIIMNLGRFTLLTKERDRDWGETLRFLLSSFCLSLRLYKH